MRKIYITIQLLLSIGINTIIAQNYFISADSKRIPPESQPIDKFTVLDTAKLVITYNVKIKNKYNENDIRVLQIGNNYVKKFSQLLYEGDSISFALAKKGARNTPWFSKEIPPVEIYSNYNTKKNTVTYRLFGGRVVYKYVEPFSKIAWELVDEHKKILSYSCQKAIGTFRGRTYEAWFTTKIPIKEGPYKFTGLPGLILEINDLKKDYIFTCIGIKRPKQIIPLKYFKWSYVNVSREKLQKTIKQAYKYPAQYVKSFGKKIYIADNTKINPNSISFPYNPIELE